MQDSVDRRHPIENPSRWRESFKVACDLVACAPSGKGENWKGLGTQAVFLKQRNREQLCNILFKNGYLRGYVDGSGYYAAHLRRANGTTRRNIVFRLGDMWWRNVSSDDWDDLPQLFVQDPQIGLTRQHAWDVAFALVWYAHRSKWDPIRTIAELIRVEDDPKRQEKTRVSDHRQLLELINELIQEVLKEHQLEIQCLPRSL